MADQKAGIKLVAQNRRARHDYEIAETFECGLVLRGAEVKSFREGKVNLRESFARVEGGEVWVFAMHVSPWANASSWDKIDPDRKRKLLLNHREIDELARKTERDSFTLVPLSVYFKDGRAKLELCLARGRKKYDKRSAIAERDANREVERQVSRAMRHGRS